MNLVVVDALSRSFAEGCGNRVDVRGGALAMEETGPKNALVKRALVAYLRSGDAVVLNAHALATIGQDRPAHRRRPYWPPTASTPLFVIGTD